MREHFLSPGVLCQGKGGDVSGLLVLQRRVWKEIGGESQGTSIRFVVDR